MNTEESFYYNALAVLMDGDRGKIGKAKKTSVSWKTAYEKLAGRGALPLSRPGFPDAETEWKKLEESHVRLVLEHDEPYPALLKEIPDRPFGLYIKGTWPSAIAPSLTLAIVGTRRATPDGKDVTRRFARELAQAGSVIVSGLAFGVDAAAHEGCLEGGGTTIAVLAGGLNDIYPRENAKLAERILASGGAIISEYPFGSPPYPDRFLERNRIVSGLSRGVLIVEAPAGSGALATARDASEQNRELFVVPGSTLHPNFTGSHELIRQGAELVTSPEDILASYGITREKRTDAAMDLASPVEKQVLEALRAISTPADVDKIAAMTKLEPRIVNQTLSFLLLRGAVKERSEGYTI